MSDLTPEQQDKLAEILDTWETYGRTIRFISVVGNIIKWILGACSAVAIIWSVAHGMGSPK